MEQTDDFDYHQFKDQNFKNTKLVAEYSSTASNYPTNIRSYVFDKTNYEEIKLNPNDSFDDKHCDIGSSDGSEAD
jgi:hypothetical protein